MKTLELKKAERHAHLYLSAPIEFFGFPKTDRHFLSFQSFEEQIYQRYLPLLNSDQKRLAAVEAALKAWIADGVSCVEASLDYLSVLRSYETWSNFKVSLQELFDRYSSKINVRLELGVARQRGLADKDFILELLSDPIFVGIDLYGAEQGASIDDYLWLFNHARELGRYLKLHTGEQCSSNQMMAELKVLIPDAIQHGIAALKDERLLDLIAKNKIALNLAPASNLALGYISSYAELELEKLISRDIKFTINTDDFAIFNQSISQQLAELLNAGILSQTQIEKVARDSLIQTVPR